jgi:hypothetical protein
MKRAKFYDLGLFVFFVLAAVSGGFVSVDSQKVAPADEVILAHKVKYND